MPTPSVYIMEVALIAPVLVSDLSIPVLQAHLFMLYLGCMSAITPLMATACFSAATIAEPNPMVIAVQAVKQGIPGFILPLFFVFNAGVLGIGSAIEVISATLVGIVLVVVSCLAIHGWMAQIRLPSWFRLGFAALAVALIYLRPKVQYVAAGAGDRPIRGAASTGEDAGGGLGLSSPIAGAPCLRTPCTVITPKGGTDGKHSDHHCKLGLRPRSGPQGRISLNRGL